MIVLDTHVVSEMMKIAPSRTALDWLNAQDAASPYVTTITIAEIGYGLRLLPDSQRRNDDRSVQIRQQFQTAQRSGQVNDRTAIDDDHERA